MAKVRAGVIGCGFVTELHIYAYALVHLRARVVVSVIATRDGGSSVEPPHYER